MTQWQSDIEKARARRKTVSKWWDANLKKYAPDQASQDPDQYGSDVNTNRDFTLVERKKADLFDQRPEVTALPSPLIDAMEGAADVLDTHTAIMAEKLGLEGVDAETLADAVVFDVLCTSGTGWTVMGYDSTTVDTQTPDPNWQAPQIPHPTLPGQMMPDSTAQAPMITVPVPIFEDCYWTYISPKQGLKPHDFRSSDWDKAPWLGYEFEMPVRVAKRKGWVPETFVGAAPSPETRFQFGGGNTAGDAVASGVLIYYKSALYRDDRVHPQHQTLLILIDGVSEPVEHKDSPLQTLDAQGRLTPDSLIGFPIHPLTIRTLTDSSDVPSDCSVSRPQVNELNKFREQMVENRDSQLIVGFYDAGKWAAADVEKTIKARMNGLVGLPSEVFEQAEPIKPIARSPYPRENFSVNDYIDNDLARTHALDSNAQGVQGEAQTATAASFQRDAVNRRLGKERGKCLAWYLKGYTKYSTIVMRYLPLEEAQKIVGPQKAAAWDGFRKQIPARLAFTAMPDSTQRTDLAVDRKQAMEEYSFFANDPFIVRSELLKKLLPKLHYSQKVLNLKPQDKSPEPPNITMSIATADLDPTMPAYGNVFQVLTQLGFKNLAPPTIDPVSAHAMQAAKEALASPQTAHGGKVAPTENLSKHQADRTGAMQGTGAPSPMGPGGMIQ
jgi:hypothetical protein